MVDFEEMTKEQSLVIRNTRVMATIVIVAYHCVCPYLVFDWQGYGGDLQTLNRVLRFIFREMLCTTMLPTFFMLSGMLFYSKKNCYADIKYVFWKKFDRLIIPFVLVFTFCSLIKIPRIGIGISYGHLWFVCNLFLYFCVALLFYKIREIYLLLGSIVSFAFFAWRENLGLSCPIVLGDFMQYAIYFWGGHYVAKNFGWMRTHTVFKWSVLLVWIFALFFHYQIIYKLLFNLVLLSFMPLIGENKTIAYLDKQSFRIYLIHHVLLFALFAFPYFKMLYADDAMMATTMMFCTLMVLTLCVCWILDKVSFKYF